MEPEKGRIAVQRPRPQAAGGRRIFFPFVSPSGNGHKPAKRDGKAFFVTVYLMIGAVVGVTVISAVLLLYGYLQSVIR
ncbi:MAG: hypothetical protein ACK4Z6_08230 [Candidatus Methylomirabilales bacterium]